MRKLFYIVIENGVVISLFLGLAYLFTFLNQRAKMDYYGIPLIYIDLNIGDVIDGDYIFFCESYISYLGKK